ncbi:MAG: hypothetical protein ACSLFA_14760 [Mycobacterium sp.]
MARTRRIGHRLALPCLLLGATALSGCGIHIETIAQPLLYDAAPASILDATPSASLIFAPCVSAKADPLENAASAITDLLVGKDRYRSDCVPDAGASIPLHGIIERAARVLTPQPVMAIPPDPQSSAMLVTDELVTAVQIGEYWFMPAFGPA